MYSENEILFIENKIRADEKERIIKLLEAPYFHHTYFGARGVDDEPAVLHDGECIGCYAIALIKGEK